MAAGNGYPIPKNTGLVFEDNDRQLNEWIEELLKEFDALGHGVHFQHQLQEGENYSLVTTINEATDLQIKNLTVLWTSHDFLFLIFHEPKNFI